MNTYSLQKRYKTKLAFIILAFIVVAPVHAEAARLFIDVNKSNLPGAATPRNYTTYAPPGSPITIDWDMLTIQEGATNCYAPLWSPSYGISGSGTVYPTVDTSYRLYCMFPYATSAAFYDINIIFGTVQPPPTATLFTNTPTIPSGGTAILTYTCTDSTSATISGIGSVNPTSGAVSVSPSSTTVYTLTCTGNGTATDTKTVTVTSLPVATLVANNPVIINGGSSLLSYSCTNSPTSASINNGVGPVSPASGGNASVSPSTTTTYTLTCTNASGSAVATATVTVVPVLSASCSVSPTSISAGTTATWSAVASGGTGTYTYSWSGTDGLTGSGSSVTFPYGVAGPKTASVTVTSGTQSITSACSNTLTVNPGALPDLTVTTPPAGATSFTAGTAQSYTGSVQNIGGATATAYPNVMQVLDSTGNTSLAYFVASPAVVTTAAGAASAVSGTVPAGAYPFNTAGTYKVRFCANMNNVGSFIIPETSPLNNCGPNTPAGTITVVVGSGGTPALSCTVSPTSLPASGGLATWTVTPSGGATGPYTWAPIGFSGYSVVSPTAVSHTFTSADAGQNYSMHVSSANVPAGVDCTPSLPVGSVCAGSPTGTLTANPNRIRANTSTSITFALPNIQNVKTSCTLSGPGMATPPAPFNPNSCTVSGSFTTNITIATQSTYTLTCDNLKTATAIINVLPNFQEF